MPDWACTRCGEVNLEGQAVCGGCGRETRGPERAGSLLNRVLPDLPRGGHIVRSTPLPAKRPDTTPEQNKAAIGVVHAVARGELTAEEGQQRLTEIFPELQEGF